MSYGLAMEYQQRLWRQVVASSQETAFLMLLEHDPPVITAGPSARPEHILASKGQLAEAGVEVLHVRRGGGVTYHGPGQLVGYLVLDLRQRNLSLRQHMRCLEESLIRTLRRLGIPADRSPGLTGVWVGRAKIAAIGVAARRGVTLHGFALNILPEMSHFGLIVPCGIAERSVTSLRQLLATLPPRRELMANLVRDVGDVFRLDRLRGADVNEVFSLQHV
jgi:lipoate-protein ligase B